MEAGIRSSSSQAAAGVFAEVAVAAGSVRGARTFHYCVPPALVGRLTPGQLVRVEFGQRRLHGILLDLTSQSPVLNPKPVLGIVLDTPLLDPRTLQFGRWMARHFGAPIADCMEALLPPNLDRYLVHTLMLQELPGGAVEADLRASEKAALAALAELGSATRDELAGVIGKGRAAKALGRLIKAGYVKESVELRLPASGVRAVALAVTAPAAREAMAGMVRAPKRRALLELLTERPGPIPLAQLLNAAGASPESLKALVAARLVRIDYVYLLPQPEPVGPKDEATPGLTDETAWQALESFLGRDGHGVCLLLGEAADRSAAYVRAVEQVVGAGLQVVVLAPTEAEAMRLYATLAGRIAGQVAFTGHARNPARRVGLWRSLRSGEIDVLVGPRSAVFSPLSRLGLVIVDREEDRNYKDRRATRMSARDAAVQLGRLHRCPVVLGSDTPSVESFYQVEQERYRFILMGSAGLLRATRMKVGRGWGSQRPAGVVDVVDMRTAHVMGHGGMISEHLHRALVEAAAAEGKAVLFVNRRGVASVTACRDCGYIFGCPNCSTSLVQHGSIGSVVCHVCNHREPVPKSCPECGSRRLRLWGYGTEAVSESLKRLFPGERVDRIDSDVKADSIAAVAEGFERGAIRFLVGTTLLFSAGASLSCGTLGVVQADVGLGFPDYTAPERVFQTLMRLRRAVLGGGLEGQMILQTIMPEHHVIEAVRIGSYLRFFRSELEIRRAHAFPPLRRLVRFSFAHASAEKARVEAENLGSNLRMAVTGSSLIDVQLLGPAPCLQYRERGKYRWHIIALGPVAALEPLLGIPHLGWVVEADPVELS